MIKKHVLLNKNYFTLHIFFVKMTKSKKSKSASKGFLKTMAGTDEY